MDYRIEIRRILDLHDISLKKFSDDSGLSYGYVRKLLKPSEINGVHWQRLFVLGYELGRDSLELKKKSTATQ